MSLRTFGSFAPFGTGAGAGLGAWRTLHLAAATFFGASGMTLGGVGDISEVADVITWPVTPPGGDDGIREGDVLAWPFPADWRADGTQALDLRLDGLLVPSPAATTICTSVGVRTSGTTQGTWQGRGMGYSDDAAGPRARVVGTSTSTLVSGTVGTGAPQRIETVFVPSKSTGATVALSCAGRLVCATTRTAQLCDAFDNDLTTGEQAIFLCITAPTAATARTVGGRLRYRVIELREQADT